MPPHLQLLLLASTSSALLLKDASCDQFRQARLTQLRSSLSALREDVGNIQSEIVHLNDKSTNFQEKIKNYASSIKADDEKIEEHLKEIKNLNLLVTQRTEAAKRAQESFDSAEKQLNSTEMQSQQMEEKLKAMQGQLEQVNRKENDLYIKLNMVNTDVDNYNKSYGFAAQSELAKRNSASRASHVLQSLHQNLLQAHSQLNQTNGAVLKAKKDVEDTALDLNKAEALKEATAKQKQDLDHQISQSDGKVHFEQQRYRALTAEAEGRRTGELTGAQGDIEEAMDALKLLKKKLENARAFLFLLRKAEEESEWEIAGNQLNANDSSPQYQGVLHRGGDDTDVSNSEFAAAQVVSKAKQLMNFNEKLELRHATKFSYLQLERAPQPSVDFSLLPNPISDEVKLILQHPNSGRVNQMTATQLDSLRMDLNLHIHSANMTTETLAAQEMVAVEKLKETLENAENKVNSFVNLKSQIATSAEALRAKREANRSLRVALQDKITEVSEIDSRLASLSKLAEQKQASYESLVALSRQRLSDLNQLQAQVNGGESEYDDLVSTLKQSQKDTEDVKGKLAAAAQAKEGDEKKYSEIGVAQHVLEKALREAQSDHTRLEESEENRRQELHFKKEQLDAADDQVSDLTTSLVQALSALDTAKDAKQRNRKELERASREASATEEDIVALNRKLKSALSEQDSTKAKIAKLTALMGTPCRPTDS